MASLTEFLLKVGYVSVGVSAVRAAILLKSSSGKSYVNSFKLSCPTDPRAKEELLLMEEEFFLCTRRMCDCVSKTLVTGGYLMLRDTSNGLVLGR